MQGITPPNNPNNRPLYQLPTDNCPVCLETLEAFAGRAVKVIETCGHMFHEDCLKPWVPLSTSCPLCRREVQPAPASVGNPDLRGNAPLDRRNMIREWLSSRISAVTHGRVPPSADRMVESLTGLRDRRR